MENNGKVAVISRDLSAQTIDIPNGSQDHLVAVKSRLSLLKKKEEINKVLLIFLLVLIILLLIALVVISSLYILNNSSSNICESFECIRSAANLASSLDTNVDPCTDFYAFTCGNWADEHPRPDSSLTYDWFANRQEHVIRHARDFLKMNSSNDDPLPVKQARDLYTACMDTEEMDDLGFTPIYEFLEEVGLPRIPHYFTVPQGEDIDFDWIKISAMLFKLLGKHVILGFDICTDPRNNTLNKLCFGIPSLSSPLPSHSDFEQKINKIMKVLKEEDDDKGDDSITEASLLLQRLYAKEVMRAVISENITEPLENFEINLVKAAAMITNISNNFYLMIDNLTDTLNSEEMNVDDLQNYTDQYVLSKQLTPYDIFRPYLSVMYDDTVNVTLDLNDTDRILIGESHLDYLAFMAVYVRETPNILLELYVWWETIETLVSYTTEEMRELYERLMQMFNSIEASEARSIHCTKSVNSLMGNAIAYGIGEKDFMNTTKPKVAEMLSDIRKTFKKLVGSIDWMDYDTKKATLEKCEKMNSFIGYPSWLYEKGGLELYYEGMTVDPKRYLQSLMSFMQLLVTGMLENLRLFNDINWATDPTDVNAFHTFQENAITVPLAILQYPFYHLGLEALNYGAIGTILGHELTHGFDDSGRQFDKNGNIRQWWTDKTIEEYVNRTECFIQQYNKYYIPEIKLHVNGELTLGENIADNGGLKEAFLAYQLYVNRRGREPLLPGLEKYSHEQLFFIAYGNLWCETSTKAFMKWAWKNDVHSPNFIRLHATLTNLPEFSKAFQCSEGSPMNPKREKCRIW